MHHSAATPWEVGDDPLDIRDWTWRGTARGAPA